MLNSKVKLIWMGSLKFVLLAVYLLVWSLGVWAQTAPFVKGILSWTKPAIAIQNNWLWEAVNGTQDEVPQLVEVALTTPLTDMNAVQPGAPPIDVSPFAMPVAQADGSFQLDYSAKLAEKLGNTTGTYATWVRVFDAAGLPSLWARSGDFRFDVLNPAAPAGVKMTIEVTQTTKITIGG